MSGSFLYNFVFVLGQSFEHPVPKHRVFPIYMGHLKPIDDEEVRALRTRELEILTELKYVRMAAFAEL